MSSAENNCQWHFAQSLGGQDQGPNDAMSEPFKKDRFEAIVRESIQNSLDAQADKEQPVIVTFKFKSTDAKNYPRLFDIEKHIHGCLDMYNDNHAHRKFDPMLEYLAKARDARMDYLEVSDENTTGMDYSKDDTKSGFYSFVKSAGNSSKASESAGGSYGFGKAAYFNLSKIRTVLISTLTTDNKYFFEGVSSLCTHKINGKKLVPVGYYCDNEDEEPIRIPTSIPRRFQRETPGTSMFIMGLGMDDGDTKLAMMKINEAAVKHFWLSILSHKLIIRVEKSNQGKYELNADNLEKSAEIIFDKYDDLKRGHKNPRAYIDAVVNAGKDDKHLLFEKDIPYLGHVKYYFMICKSGNDYILNMRAPRMLVYHQVNSTDYGFYSVFVCDDENGNKLLVQSENPAHNEWDEKNATELNKPLVEKALKEKDAFIQECIRSVFVADNVETLNFGGLDEYLSIPSSLDDDDYQPNFGKPTDEKSEEETTSVSTELGDGEIQKPQLPTLGEVRIKKKKQPKQSDNDGEGQQTGHTPEKRQEKEKEDEEEEQDKEKQEKDKEKKDKPESKDANDGPQDPMTEDEDGLHLPPMEPLKISYRTYAQNGEEGLEHKLVIHSNRATNRAVISIISGGETSDVPLTVQRSDNGNILNNQLTKVHLAAGKTVIRVWFEDGMRHAIKLDVYEDQ